MDKQTYPVVNERALAPVSPKRLFGKAPRRSSTEVPVPMVGQCLVYRTHGQYTLDTANLPLDSATVVEAAHVSLVDITPDTEVPVEVPLPSKDGSFFTMRVTFLCTVEDPVEVVRAGGSNAAHMLTGYLRGHQRNFEIGLNYAIDHINDVRLKLSAQVRAYATVSPPGLQGMRTSLASVEVRTPDEVVEFQGKMRATQRDHAVRTEELTNSEMLDDLKERHQQRREQRGGTHLREMDAAQKEHERTELQRTAEAVGMDPFAVLTLAYTSGKIDAKEFADRAAAVREDEIAQDREDMRNRVQYDRQRDTQRWDAEREDLKQELEQRRIALDDQRRELAARNDFDRERERSRWDAEREDIKHQQEMQRRRELDHAEANREFERDLERARWEAERADRLQDAKWDREDRRLARESGFKEVEAKLEVLRELAKHGQLDMLNLRLDKFVNDLLGQRHTPTIESKESAETTAITASDDEPVDDDGEFDDEERNTKVEA
ncbi:hypothetical protein V5P93_000710 [Actinokineospora auranticolor]|uniref:Uncharacterized protein n=1 Tax=Actinokineospora auranticolor TaxID=155976 RepID=A0A2S6GYU7_9PSEU|nr:hypothetical protein [Actinokineospora auranticolor]PPK70409.1 hypothetical protein CLV40_102324 [Actinokineospora auranticolor]